MSLDFAAQKVIADGLRSKFRGLKVVGEEEEKDEDWPPLTKRLTSRPSFLTKSTATSPFRSTIPAILNNLPIEDVTVFFDLLGGTKEFVEGQLANVQT
jgi:3'-phosphoadenosine 5'-phosphosulfate (PAPS) 3'-phosphatase